MAEPLQYQSLYRRYRPQRFSEVLGQGHVVLALRNAVRDGKVAHAYLFSGPRGTGKTSTARILAKALNCVSPVDGEPCGQCDSCRDIARGASLDVHELDAASNNGVDAMRDLVARASLATPGKWKVYIVDEVHMLSAAASNALLKTLEEPPGHVVFVLATTDPQKVLPTIRSRTQHYEFHLLDPAVLAALLTEVALKAQLEIPPDGVEAAVRRGHGSARDALSALDQVAAAGLVEDDDRFVRQLVAAVVERDTRAALETVGGAMVAGFDAARLAAELVDAFRVIFLGVVAPGLSPAHEVAAGKALPSVGPARCVRALEVIGAAIVDMRESLDARTTFEVALVRLTHPEADDGPAALLDRLERLERRVQELASNGGSGAPPPGRPLGSTAEPSEPAPTGATARPALGAFRQAGGAPPAPPAGTGDPASGEMQSSFALHPDTVPAAGIRAPGTSPTGQAGAGQAGAGGQAGAAGPVVTPSRDDLVTSWADHVLPRLRPRVRAVYAVGRFVSSKDGNVEFALPNSAHVEHAEPLREEVAAALGGYFGGRLDLRLVTDPDSASEAAALVAMAPEGGAMAPTGGAMAPEGGAMAPAGGAMAPEVAARAVGGAGEGGGRAPRGRPEPAADGARRTAPVPVADFESEVGEAAGSHDPLEWAQTRLLQEFPGAEEVPDGK